MYLVRLNTVQAQYVEGLGFCSFMTDSDIITVRVQKSNTSLCYFVRIQVKNHSSNIWI